MRVGRKTAFKSKVESLTEVAHLLICADDSRCFDGPLCGCHTNLAGGYIALSPIRKSKEVHAVNIAWSPLNAAVPLGRAYIM